MRYILSTAECPVWENEFVYPVARSEEITVEDYSKGKFLLNGAM